VALSLQTRVFILCSVTIYYDTRRSGIRLGNKPLDMKPSGGENGRTAEAPTVHSTPGRRFLALTCTKTLRNYRVDNLVDKALSSGLSERANPHQLNTLNGSGRNVDNSVDCVLRTWPARVTDRSVCQ